jgi:flagellar brake protein
MAETSSSDLLAAYTLTDKQTILDKLRMMQRNGSLLTVAENGVRSGVASAIVKVVPEKGMIALEAVASKERSRRLTASQDLWFRAVVNGADVRFRADRMQEATLNGQAVLAVPIPSSLVWMQRRECYRVPLSRTASVICRVPLPNDEVAEFEILNVSLMGLALLDRSGQLEYWGRVGQVFSNCRLLIDDFREEPVSLEIRNKRSTTATATRRSLTRVGFAFKNLSRSFVRKLQRYINELERVRRRPAED